MHSKITAIWRYKKFHERLNESLCSLINQTHIIVCISHKGKNVIKGDTKKSLFSQVLTQKSIKKRFIALVCHHHCSIDNSTAIVFLSFIDANMNHYQNPLQYHMFFFAVSSTIRASHRACLFIYTNWNRVNMCLEREREWNGVCVY